MSFRPPLRVFLVGLVLGALAGWFLSRRFAPAQAPAAPARPAPRTLPAPAHTAGVERVRLPELELLPATLRSRRSSQIAAELAGRVLRVTRQVGERVREGELLVDLDASSLQASREESLRAREAAEAGVASAAQAEREAAAVLEEARAHRERTEKLFESGSSTRAELEQASARHAGAEAALAQAASQVTAARAGVARAAAAVESAEIMLARTRILAPFAGVVSERGIEPGEIAAPGRVLLVLVDPGALRALASAREELAAGLRPGDTLEVEVPATGQSLQGRIEELVPRIDERSRSLEVRLALPDAAEALPGMFARVRLPRAPREHVLVTSAALERVGQLASVRVREGDAWRRRYVSVGATQPDGRIEVLSGLSGGETVGWDGGGAR